MPQSVAAEIRETFDMDGVIVFAFARRLDSMAFAIDGRSGEDSTAMQSAAEAFLAVMSQVTVASPGDDAVTEMCQHNAMLMAAAKKAISLLEKSAEQPIAVACAIETLREAVNLGEGCDDA
ncbi:MAG: hypothetical protein AAFU85_30670 [Planctomycetota bacterium]